MTRNTDTKANFILWYKDVFGFSTPVVICLYEEQLLQNKKTLAELNDSNIDSICCVIRQTKAIAEISAARLKLAIFWIKHQDRTMHKIGLVDNQLVKVNLDKILTLKEQKCLEDDWRSGNKEPKKYSPRAFDMALATKAFDKTRTILTRVRGATGVPLAHVIRHVLEPEKEDEDPPFGETNLIYTSIDQKLIAQAEILHEDRST